MKKAERQKVIKNFKEIIDLIDSDKNLRYEVEESLTEFNWKIIRWIYNNHTHNHDANVINSLSEIFSERKFTYENEENLRITIYLDHIVSYSILRRTATDRYFFRITTDDKTTHEVYRDKNEITYDALGYIL